MNDEVNAFVFTSSFIVHTSSFNVMVDTQRNTFPSSHRLSGKLSFSAVYDARVRESGGPLTIYAKPNELAHLRLGLSISRKVGTAPRRNRIKRLLREAFRLKQHELPSGYDLIIVVRPHEPLSLIEYQDALSKLTAKLHVTWSARKQNESK